MSMVSRIAQRLARTFFGETLVATSATLLADLTDVQTGSGLVVIQNNGGGSIFYCLTGSATTAPTATLLTTTGITLLANGKDFLDGIGGCAVWAVASATQTAGSGTRITGAKV